MHFIEGESKAVRGGRAAASPGGPELGHRQGLPDAMRENTSLGTESASSTGSEKHKCREKVALKLPCATWIPRIGKNEEKNATECLEKNTVL